jgi:hypothetical protein
MGPVIGRLLQLLVTTCIVVSGCEREAQHGPTKLTSAHFEQIFDGMSYAGVEYLLGTDWKVSSTLDQSDAPPGVHASAGIREWRDGDRRISVDFLNGKVINKAAEGL